MDDQDQIQSTIDSLNQSMFAVNRLQNLNNVGVGQTLPARTRAGIGVPVVSSVAAKLIEQIAGFNHVQVTWLDPTSSTSVDHYNIYIKGAMADQLEPTMCASSRTSPAAIYFPSDAVRSVVITVQTVLTNGQSSDIGTSPTAAITSMISDTVVGAETLQHAGRAVKVTDGGTVGESSRLGTGITAQEPFIVDLGTSPTESQYVATANGLGAFDVLVYAAGEVGFTFDAIYHAGVFKATDTTVARLAKSSGLVKFSGAGSQSVGATATFNDAAVWNPSTGYWRFGDGTTPLAPLSVAGAFRTDGKCEYYNGALTASTGIGLVPVSDHVDLFNQSSSHSATALQVGSAMATAGQYRIDIYANTHTAGSGNISMTVSWADGIGTKTSTSSFNLTSGAFAPFSANSLYTGGSTDITYAITYTGTGTYDFHATLMKLS